MPRVWMGAVAAVLAAALSARAEEAKLDTPEKCLEAYKAATVKADGKALLRCFTEATRKKIFDDMKKAREEVLANKEEKESVAKDLGVTVEQLEKMTLEEYTIAEMSAVMKGDEKKAAEAKFEVIKKEEARAVAVFISKEGREKFVLLAKDGEWGIDMEESVKLQKEDTKDEDDGGDGSGK